MTDEHAAEREKGLVDVGAAFVAHAQAAKAVEPGEGTLDHPAMAAELLRIVLPATSDAWRGSHAGARLPGSARSRSPCRRAASWAGGVDDLDVQRWAGRYRELPPASWSHARWRPKVRRPRAARYALPQGGASCPGGRDRPDSGRFSRPFLRGDRTRVQAGAAPVQPGGVSQTLQEHLVQGGPHPGLVPVAQPPPARHARAAAHLRGQQLPGCAGTQHKNNAGQHSPI